MKMEKVFLDELNSNSKGYKVRVKVIEKNRSRESPQKKVTYQSLLLQDEKGNKMKAALFGEQVDGYKNVIVYNGEYEIANAIIRPTDQRWKSDSSALDYQMTFNKNSVVQPVDGTTEHTAPQYRKIADIPKFADASERFDVIAAVLFVEDPPGKVVTFGTRSSTVREFMIIDESVKQPLVVSAWHDLAENDCDLLQTNITYLPLVGLTALRPSNHKGFSLTTTLSTTVIHEPEGEADGALQSWVSKNRLGLNKMRLKIMAAKSTISLEDVSTIASLLERKVDDVLQDEKHILEVTVPEPDFDKLHAYVGCSVCGKATDTLLGKTFTCEVCHKMQCVASPKVTFKCDVSDGTGAIPFTLFTEACETLFKLSASDIFHMRHSDDYSTFEKLKELIQTTPARIQVCPSTSLTKNRVLQWVLQHVTVSQLNKQEKPQQKEPRAKRRLIMHAHSSSSEGGEADPEIDDDVLTPTSAKHTSEEQDDGPFPSNSQVTPLDV